jgi:hypothetical protein
MTNFPTGLDSLTNPISSNTLASPDHAAQHSDENDAIEALQAKVGIDSSAVTSSIDYKIANSKKDVTTLIVDPNSTRADYATIAAAITYLGTLSTTNGYMIRLSAGNHLVTDTITVNLTMPIMILGNGSAMSNINAHTGLLNKNMFVIKSRCDFDRIYFYGDTLTGWNAGTNGSFIKYDTDGVYSELQNFGMQGGKKGVEITAAAEIFAFDFIIENCGDGCHINAAGKVAAIDFEVGNMVNCAVGFNLAAATTPDVYLVTLRFLQEAGNVGIEYNGTNFVYHNFSIQTCEWNNVGTFSTGLDFSLQRDANIEILGCVGIEDKKPHAKINFVSNASLTALTLNTWAKAEGTNSSSYSTKFGIANNRMTYLSTHPRDLMMVISGSMMQTTATQNIEIAIVKNGDSGTLYGKNSLICDSANRSMPFSTTVYLQSPAVNSYYELWIRNVSDNDDATLVDLNWLTFSM